MSKNENRSVSQGDHKELTGAKSGIVCRTGIIIEVIISKMIH